MDPVRGLGHVSDREAAQDLEPQLIIASSGAVHPHGGSTHGSIQFCTSSRETVPSKIANRRVLDVRARRPREEAIVIRQSASLGFE
jgi:hypothetical protein